MLYKKKNSRTIQNNSLKFWGLIIISMFLMLGVNWKPCCAVMSNAGLSRLAYLYFHDCERSHCAPRYDGQLDKWKAHQLVGSTKTAIKEKLGEPKSISSHGWIKETDENWKYKSFSIEFSQSKCVAVVPSSKTITFH